MGFVVNLGLRCFRDWSRAGDFEKCRSLSLRLLEIEPYHADLNVMLVQATEQLEGYPAARAVAGKRMALYREAELDPPPELTSYLEGYPDYSQHHDELALLLQLGDLSAAFDYFEALAVPFIEAVRLEWKALQRNLTVNALRQVNAQFERGDLKAALTLAERTFDNNSLSARVAEILLSVIGELHGETAASSRALDIKAKFAGAGYPISSVLERYVQAPVPLSERGG